MPKANKIFFYSSGQIFADIENPGIEKYKSPESSDVWYLPGSSLHNLSVSHPEVIEIIEQYNYFGFPRINKVYG